VVTVRVPWVVDCSLPSVDLTILLSDRRLHSWEFESSIPLDCPVVDPGPGTEDTVDTDSPAADDPAATEKASGGCACDSGQGPVWGWAIGLLALARWRG
jgi:hypothetical protein